MTHTAILMFIAGLVAGAGIIALLSLAANRGRDVYDELADVRAFHDKFGFFVFDRPGHLTTRKARERYEFMLEELCEFHKAVEEQNLEGQGDALIDLVYVAKGTALMLGLPWEEMWEEVQRANMDKVHGRTHRNNAADVTKPKGWMPPQHEIILACNGYDRSDWFSASDKQFIEQYGRDDHMNSLNEIKVKAS